MKIHSLKLQGFGPFRDPQSIDFDALSQDKIFMLEGPTGSGKSSIIDAIVFALYGKTAHEAATKDGPAGDRIRSNYCAGHDQTTVVLEFTTGGSRYRVSRTAAYNAPKQSGEGTAPVNQKATLEFIHPVHAAISQVREVNPRLKEELFMDHEQFSRMVVLPQGDFASFLHASTEKRRKVLEDIFKTYFFDDLHKLLDLKAKAVIASINQWQVEVDHHLRNLQREAKSSLADEVFEKLAEIIRDPNLDSALKEAELMVVVTQMKPDSTGHSAEKEAIEKIINPLRESLTRLTDSRIKIVEKELRISERDQLVEKEGYFAGIKEQLDLYGKVTSLSTLLEDRETSESLTKKHLKEIPQKYQESTPSQIKDRINELNRELPVLTKKALDANESLVKLEEVRAKIEESITIEAAIQGIPKLTEELQVAEDSLKLITTAVKDYRKKQNESAVSQAVKLLQAGQPCPVCGSKEHPDPADSGDFDPSHLDTLEEQKDENQGSRDDLRTLLKVATNLSEKNLTPSKDLQSEEIRLQKLLEDSDAILTEHRGAQEELEELNSVHEHVISYESARQLAKTANDRIVEGLTKAGIDEVQLVKTLAIDIEKNQEELSRYQDRLKELNTLLNQQEYLTLTDEETINQEIEAVSEQLEAKSVLLAEINERIALHDRILTAINDAHQGIVSAIREVDLIRTEGNHTITLKDWVSGTNPADLTLTDFVLQERLKMILEYASKHLRRMSSGKYEFRLYEERQGRVRKAGLGITIVDYFAGSERATETLSGGETFYASLALALGLVEVVKADNGGIELGTLFIDEGFGSLSEDTLEEVIDVLEELRRERVIGIISHVEGMRSQIPIRLEVRKSDEGPSFVRMAIAGMT